MRCQEVSCAKVQGASLPNVHMMLEEPVLQTPDILYFSYYIILHIGVTARNMMLLMYVQ